MTCVDQSPCTVLLQASFTICYSTVFVHDVLSFLIKSIMKIQTKQYITSNIKLIFG